MLQVGNLTVRHHTLTALDSLSFILHAGEWLMVAGPNGAGKSTLVQAIAQSVAYEGTILYRQRNIQSMRPHLRAREIGFLAQSHQVGYAFTVEEVVNLGRYAHRQGFFAQTDPAGERRVADALAMTGMLALKDQSVLTLSGGELQRTFLAQIFAQNPNLLILDEPTNHLDLKYQKQMFEMIGQWLQQPDRAAISVVHDINLARAFGTHALLLDGGKRVAFGENRAVLSRDHLQAVYGMDVQGWMCKLLTQWDA